MKIHSFLANFRVASAVLAVSITLPVQLVTPSFSVAAPSDDGIVPTVTEKPPCMAWTYVSQAQCQADNAVHTYYMDSIGALSLEAVDKARVTDAMNRWDNATDVTTTYDSTPVFEYTGETDVIVQEGAFGAPENIRGVTWCEDPQNDAEYKCDQHYLRMRGGGVINERLSAHEIGHSLGFVHPHNWWPTRGSCSEVVGIMKLSYDCLDGPALGAAVKENADWVY